MDYFIVSMAPYVVNPIVPTGIDSNKYNYKMNQTTFEALENVQIAYYVHKESSEICDILQKPTFLISDKIKRLWHLYDNAIAFKALQCFATEITDKTAPLYWVPCLEILECLHPATTKYDNGLIKQLVLEKAAIEGKEIFRVGGLLEDKVIISLSVAESLLRRSLYGIGLQKVEVR